MEKSLNQTFFFIKNGKKFDDLRCDNQENIRNKLDGKSTNDSIKKKIFPLRNIFNWILIDGKSDHTGDCLNS